MARHPTHLRHHSDRSDDQWPVCPVTSTASVHKNSCDNRHTAEPACGKQAGCSKFTDSDKSQLYSRDHCNYTFSDSVSDNSGEVYFENMNDKCEVYVENMNDKCEVYFENMNDKCNEIGNHDFGRENDREDHQMLNSPGHCLATCYQISNGERQDEMVTDVRMVGSRQALTTDHCGIHSSQKSVTGAHTPVLAINPSERKSSIGTTNSDNTQTQISGKSSIGTTNSDNTQISRKSSIGTTNSDNTQTQISRKSSIGTTNSDNTQTQISRKSDGSRFTNNPKVCPGKSKYTSAAVLPPCRICGAKASGLHYGVNSCEACKGFFRRALKRPMVFKCPKSKKCDVKGNKRSTCRFCRYKKCLSLGMARESIKTGRYSYKKRTRDTIEVKRLQRLPDLTTSEPDLDTITKHLLTAHDHLIVSTTDAPSDWLYQKQLEYHNIYLLHKKFVHHPELITDKCLDPSLGPDNPSRPSDNKDFQLDGQLVSPSRSVSQSSSDSGFVDEASANGYKAAISTNDHFNKHDTSPKCLPHSKDPVKEQRTKSICVNDTNQHDISAVKTFEQHSADKQTCALNSYKRECSLCTDYSPSMVIDASMPPFSDENIPRVRTICCCEKNNQTNCHASYQDQNNRKTADLKVIHDYKHSEEYLSNNMFRNTRMLPSMKNGPGFVKCQTCGKWKTVISNDVSSRKCDDSLHTNHSGSSTEHPNSSSDATFSNCGTHTDSFNCGLLYRSPDDTNIDHQHHNVPGHTAAAESSLAVDVGTIAANVFNVGNCGSSLNLCGESDKEIAQRAKTWIQGYVDFAKEIPGFSSLSYQDQSSLLKYAWDEVWLLGTYKGYNAALGVAMTPRGICVHADEMEAAWGRHYSRFVFVMADMIKRYNPSRQLMVLLKAVCIVAPDRCPLNNAEKVSEIHWMVVSCLQRHAEKTHPGNGQIFPRLISILTSLRELSESAMRDMATRNMTCDFNILSQTLMPF